MQFSLLTKAEADDKPVGEAQEEPNRDPFLPNPKRELPPWAVYSRTVAYFNRMRGRLYAALALLVLVFFTVPIALVTLSNSN